MRMSNADRVKIKERFWEKVDKLGKNSCWNWTASRAGSGFYGSFKYKGKGHPSHRISWLIHFRVIPKGLCVLHTCDNHLCVNPSHLFLGTNADNSQDMVRKGRQAKGNMMPQAKLTPAAVRYIRQEHKRGVSQRQLAWKLGVSRWPIKCVVQGIWWRHVS